MKAQLGRGSMVEIKYTHANIILKGQFSIKARATVKRKTTQNLGWNAS
jgi:hypothetical protein